MNIRIAMGLLVAAAVPVLPAAAETPFFAGKTITISTHVGPGGGYDAYARLLARHLGSHLPGKPGVIVANQPGAGGLTALNYAGLVAPQDGTWIALVSQGLLVAEATSQPGFHVSLGSFQWLGNLSSSANVTATWVTSHIATIDDAKTSDVKVGSTGAGSISAQIPNVLNALLGTRFKIIYGYEGGGQMNVAMQRGELDGRGVNTWASYKSTTQDAIKHHQLNILVQIGLRKDPDLPDVPLFTDLVRSDPQKEAVAKFLSLALSIARPLAAPPKVPADRVAALRKAFDETVQDPAFLEDAKKMSAEIEPMSGVEVQSAVDQILGASKETIARTEEAMQGKWSQSEH